MNNTENVIWVGTMYGAEADKGLVELSFGTSTLQLLPAQAVSVAQQLIEAAEVARTETFLVRMIGEMQGKPLNRSEIVGLLAELRKFRQSESEGES